MFYEYAVSNIRVIDGDTIEADIDLGFGIWRRKETLRLYGINTPELNSKDPGIQKKAREAKAFVETMVREPVMITTIKDCRDKYGRYLAIVNVMIDGRPVNVNQALVEQSLAVPYMV